MNTDVCFHEVQHKFSLSFPELIYEFFISRDSFQQVFELLNINDFHHVIPVFIIMFGLAMLMKENDKFQFSWLLNGFQYYLRMFTKGFLLWIIFNIYVSTWLLFQRFVYCYNWAMFLEADDTIAITGQWWYRLQNDQENDSFMSTLYLADFISWVLCVFIALCINGLISSVFMFSTIKTFSCWLQDKLLKQSLINYDSKSSNIITCVYDGDQHEIASHTKRKKFRQNKPYCHYSLSNEEQCSS